MNTIALIERVQNAMISAKNVSNELSFKRIGYWLDQIKKNKEQDVHVSIMLVGNKTDKVRVIDKETAQKYASDHNLLYCETTSKYEENNVHTIKEQLSAHILNNYDPICGHRGVQGPDNIILLDENDEGNYYNDCCCCS